MGEAVERTVSSSARVQYFDVLRAISIVAVVVLHAAITEWHSAALDDPRWIELTWFNATLRFCVPIFFMISGALFLPPEREVTTASLLRQRIPRLLVAFSVWSLCFALIEVYAPGGSEDPGELLQRFFTGHFHLWFLLAMTGLYLALPVLRLIARDPSTTRYFLALALPFAFLAPLLVGIPVAGEVLERVLDTMKLQLVLGYSAYFLLGFVLSRARLGRRSLVVIGACGLLGVAVTGVGTVQVSRAAGEWDELFFGFLTINVAAVAVAVFVFAKAWGERYRLRGFAGRCVHTLATYSLGVYLVHPLFQSLYARMGVTTEFAPPFVSVPVLTALVLVPSLLVAMVIHRIPRVGPWLA